MSSSRMIVRQGRYHTTLCQSQSLPVPCVKAKAITRHLWRARPSIATKPAVVIPPSNGTAAVTTGLTSNTNSALPLPLPQLQTGNLPQMSWTKQWWPIAAEENLDPSLVHKETLLGKDLVLWRTADGTWCCFDNACPHRGAPDFLAESMVQLKKVWDKILAYRADHNLFQAEILKSIDIQTEPLKKPSSQTDSLADPIEKLDLKQWAFREEPSLADNISAPSPPTAPGTTPQTPVTPAAPRKPKVTGVGSAKKTVKKKLFSGDSASWAFLPDPESGTPT